MSVVLFWQWCDSRGPVAVEGHLGLRIWQLHCALWPQAHSLCCCQRMCVCVCVSVLLFIAHVLYVCLLSSVFIEIPHYLAGKQQPIKITAICMPKLQPIYPGSLLKVQGFNMQRVWARRWVRLSCAQHRGDKAKETSRCRLAWRTINSTPTLLKYI